MPSNKIIPTALCLLVVSSSASALQALDDQSMSQVVGRDGVTITINTPQGVNARLIWTDNDGLQPIANQDFGILAPYKGSVIFGEGTPDKNFRISPGITTIRVDADAGTVSPFLNIAITLPQDTTIETGNIYVAGRDSANQLVNPIKIMNNMMVKLGGLNLNLQLGGSPQGDFMKITGSIVSGLRVSNVGVIASESMSSNFGIGMDEVVVKDTGASPDLTFNGLAINILPTGLQITPSAGKVVDVLVNNLRLGDLSGVTNVIGDVAIVGLKLGGTSLTIAGH